MKMAKLGFRDVKQIVLKVTQPEASKQGKRVDWLSVFEEHKTKERKHELP